MEGDYLAPKPQETELPKFEEELAAPEFVEETTHEQKAKPALAALVASETLKKNPNPEVRKLASQKNKELKPYNPASEMDPDLLRKQVEEAASRDAGAEAQQEQSHEIKGDPLALSDDHSASAITDQSNEPVVAIMPVPEDGSSSQTSGKEMRQSATEQQIFNEQPAVSIYKQAIIVGVTVAVAILAIFITIKLT